MTNRVDSPSTADDPVVAKPAKKSGSMRLRVVAVWLLVVLASVLAFGTAAEVWVKRQLLSTSAWVKASDKVLAQPEVQEALATYIVDQIYSSVDVQQQLAEQLPDNLKGLAGPISGAIRGPATSGVDTLLGTDRVQSLWHTVNETAHAALVRVLEDDTRIGSTANGAVTLDLGELVRVIGTDLGIPKSAMDKIPSDVGEITLVQSDQLAAAQTAVKVVKWMGPILVVLIIAMYALAVWLARGRRRLTLRNVGWALVLVGLALLVTRRVAGDYVSSIVSNPANGPAVKTIFSIASELLYDVAWSVVTWGLVVILGMVLIGPWLPAVAVRRFIAPVMNADTTVFWIGAGGLYVILLLWAPSPALRLWWSAIALGLLLAAGLEVLRRRTESEFPDARLDIDVDGLRSSVSDTWGSITGRLRRIGSGGKGGSSGVDPVAQLERLKALHDSGGLDDAEFSAAKQKLLA